MDVAVLLLEAEARIERDAGRVLAEDLQIGQRRRVLGEHPVHQLLAQALAARLRRDRDAEQRDDRRRARR